MGLKYNDKTGEFFEGENAPRQMRRQPVSSSLPQKRAKKHAPKTVRQFPARTPRKSATFSAFATLVKWPLYPFVKWWEVEKDSIGDGEWFFAIFWIVPLLVLVGLYKIAVSFIIALVFS